MKVKKIITEIDLNDTQNKAIKIAKQKADRLAEWSKLFHKGSRAVLIFSLLVAIFGTTSLWIAMLIYCLILMLIAVVLMILAKRTIIKAVIEQVGDEL